MHIREFASVLAALMSCTLQVTDVKLFDVLAVSIHTVDHY